MGKIKMANIGYVVRYGENWDGKGKEKVKHSFHNPDNYIITEKLAEHFDVNLFDWNDIVKKKVLSYSMQKKEWQNIQINDLDLIWFKTPDQIIARKEKFIGLIDKLENLNAIIVNDPSTMKYNFSKDYLLRIQEINPEWVSPLVEVRSTDEALKAGKRFGKSLIKPVIGEWGNGIYSMNELNKKDLEELLKKHKKMFVQKYVEGIKRGEISLVFVGKEYSHAVLKIPKKNFLANWENKAKIIPYDASKEEIKLAREVMKTWPVFLPLHITRIDLLQGNSNERYVSEIEALNPCAYAYFSNKLFNIGDKFCNLVKNYFSYLIDHKNLIKS